MMNNAKSAAASVKLIVKASNQQYEDQIVECPFSWSVLNLKTHLSETYPSKPSIPEQKLIYAGQLLTDKLILRDVIRNYELIYEQSNPIFHLVYTPKQRQMSSASNSSTSQANSSSPSSSTSNVNSVQSDGLRQRNVAASVQNQTSPNNASTNGNPQTASVNQMETNNCPPIASFGFPAGATIGGVGGANDMGNFNPNNIMAHQMAMQAWMQQTYAQYINQYMNQYMNLYGGNFASTAAASSGVGMPQFPFMPYAPPSMPIPNMQNPGTAPNAGISSNVLPQTQQTATMANNQQQIPVNNNQAPQAAQQAAAPRFPQIVQEEQENRDWLDTFYSMSRLLILLVLVYFYSSPLRCLAVLLLGVIIYLYHIGFFRNHLNVGGIEANNNIRNNRNNNNNNNNNNQQPENGAQRNAAGVAAGENQNVGENRDAADATNTSSNAVGAENPNEGTSVIAFLRTFVVSFLTSILPEAPTL